MRARLKRFALAAVVAPLVLAATADAAETRYDPRIPTLHRVAGHDTGEEMTDPEVIGAYLEALAAAAPERARVVEYARSEEGRPLWVLVLGSAERMARLADITAGLRRLADPRSLSATDAGRLLDELPVVVWLLHGVHGDEVSSSDAALALAYHLLAAEDDLVVNLVRREAIVILDPLQNPDGRARFLHSNRMARGIAPDPEPLAAEHDQPWPGGRTNHALFDLNRDWFAQTQPETRGRVQLFLDWYPQVVVDLHEMGGNSSYFFAPPAIPVNPYFSLAQQQWLERFGRAIAVRLDEAGQAYFVRERFDCFYPGYGESWPMAHGSVGMTFEQASPRGLVFRREDGGELTYGQAVENHLRAELAALEAAARGRRALLRDFLEFRRGAATADAKAALRHYVVSGSDSARVARLAELLTAEGIEVRVAVSALRAGARRFPAGSLVVDLAQPASRLARNLLEARVGMDEAFVLEQERRRRKRMDGQIYDVTAWSLPLLFDLDCVGVRDELSGEIQPFGPSTGRPLGPAKVAWLVPWGSGSAAAVIEALAAGLKVRIAEAGFRLGDRSWSAGTVIVRVAENPENARDLLARVLRRHAVEAVPTDTGYVEEGVSLGSERVRLLRSPRVLVAWDRPTAATSAGWARWVLERRYGQRASVVRVSSLDEAVLDSFDVLVLPSADYEDTLSRDTIEEVEHWIERGGTLVALGEASRWLARKKVGLLATGTELRDGSPEPDPDAEENGETTERPAPERGEDAPAPFDLERAIQPEGERPDAVPGALLRVELDREHWLAAGSDGEIHALVRSRRVFTPLKLDQGRNVGVYAQRESLVGSGLVWDDVRGLLAQKAYLMHQPIGDGHVIAFAEDPNFRGYAEATELLFLNAVLLGPVY